MKRALLHIAFWLAYLFQDILLAFFLNTSRLHLSTAQNIFLSFFNCLVLLLPKIMLTYFIFNVTLGKVIKAGFQKMGVLYSVIAFLFALICYRCLTFFFIDPFIYGWARPTASFFYPLAFLVALMDIGFVTGTAIVLKQARQQVRSQKLEQLLIRDKLETELKYLRNQTNPHFLFNTLNNIYALARKKSDNTAGAVMKLSKLLRFMLYEAASPLISIQDEIRMLEDYIDLERMRYDDKLTVLFQKDIGEQEESISPLLLLPFIENAFKHGASESRFASFINIEMSLHNSVLKFIVKNSRENNGYKMEGSPIGLSNVKRQLELLYSQYDIQLLNEPSVFIVLLTINLKSYGKNKLPHR